MQSKDEKETRDKKHKEMLEL